MLNPHALVSKRTQKLADEFYTKNPNHPLAKAWFAGEYKGRQDALQKAAMIYALDKAKMR